MTYMNAFADNPYKNMMQIIEKDLLVKDEGMEKEYVC